jgi:FMN phosphatase YigB (HAD superfamily)
MKKINRFRNFVGSGTLTIFDIDETLFHTKAKVAVVKDGKVVRMLDNQEFNTYKRKAGEEYDFREFASAEVFRKTSTPIVRMIEKAKAIVKAKKNVHSRAIIVTARADFDDKEMFLQTFRDHGLPIDSMHVERSGNLGMDSPAEAKKVVFRKYLNTQNYTKTRLYDDAMSNLKAFLELQKEYPNVKFEAYFVKPDGSIKTIK